MPRRGELRVRESRRVATGDVWAGDGATERTPAWRGPMITGLGVVLMAIGLVGVLRAVAVVTMGGEGRFRLDPVVSTVLGFGLILLGRALLDS
jgi:hypothetical protein